MSRGKPEVPEDLLRWIGEISGAEHIEVKQVSGGASRQAWFVDAGTGADRQELFLRYDPRDPEPGSAFHPCRSRPTSWPSCTGTVSRCRM